jgi:hypothetical protein
MSIATKPANQKRAWPDCYTVIEQTAAESTVWACRLGVTGAGSADEAKKAYEADGYQVIAKGYGPTGDWGYKMRKAPGETSYYSPEAAMIHQIVCEAWDKAAPTFSNRVRSKLYHVLHGAFYQHYHSEYMPSTEQLQAGKLRPVDTVNLLVEKLTELPKTASTWSKPTDTKAAREIVASVIRGLVEEAGATFDDVPVWHGEL